MTFTQALGLACIVTSVSLAVVFLVSQQWEIVTHIDRADRALIRDLWDEWRR